MTASTHVDVLIIGTGFSGLGAAIQLTRAGVEDIALLERGDDVGGTWRENTYPGCGCDVPSPLYSFSFAPKPDWSRLFAKQSEIHGYLRDCAQQFGVRDRIRFHREVQSVVWDEGESRWTVTVNHAGQSETWSARVVISGIGGFSKPAIPDIPGIETFKGPTMHTARWQHDVELKGQRVAVVGTGASGIQLVPSIAADVGELKLFQRTPPWIVPKADRAIGKAEQALYRVAPRAQRALRNTIYAQHEVRALGFTVNPRMLVAGERMARAHLRKQIPDRALRKQVTPDYPFGCKRVLISNDYYPALQRDNVSLVTGGIREINATGIVTADGQQHDVDVIVWGTGFSSQRPFERGFLVGRDGQDMWDAWSDGLSAYKGSCVHGFPNFFMISGPNTGLGHNSMVYMIESQVNMIVDAVRRMQRQGLATVDVKQSAQADWQQGIDAASKRTVWMGGCNSWYLDEAGRNTTLWPGFTFEFNEQTRRFNEADFRVTPAEEGAIAPAPSRARERKTAKRSWLAGAAQGLLTRMNPATVAKAGA